MACDLLHADDTPIRVLDRSRRSAGLGRGVKQGRIALNRPCFPGGPEIGKDGAHGRRQDEGAAPGRAARARGAEGARARGLSRVAPRGGAAEGAGKGGCRRGTARGGARALRPGPGGTAAPGPGPGARSGPGSGSPSAGAARRAGGSPDLMGGRGEPAQGLGASRPRGARPPPEAMIGLIDDPRASYGVGPMPRSGRGAPVRRRLPVAPSTYRAHIARRRDPARASARARREAGRRPGIARVHARVHAGGFRALAAPAKGLPRRTPIRAPAAARARGGRARPARPARTVERRMRAMGQRGARVARSDGGRRPLALRCAERLAEAGVAPCVGAGRGAQVGGLARHRAGRDRDRAPQDRGDPQAGPRARPRGGGARHPRTEGPRAAANGRTGSTAAAGSSAPSGPSRPPRPGRAAPSSWRPPPWRRGTPSETASGKAGAVHSAPWTSSCRPSRARSGRR